MNIKKLNVNWKTGFFNECLISNKKHNLQIGGFYKISIIIKITQKYFIHNIFCICYQAKNNKCQTIKFITSIGKLYLFISSPVIIHYTKIKNF